MLRSSRPYQLLRLSFRTLAPRVARAAMPLYFTIGIAAFVLFAGNGLDAVTVTRWAGASLWFRTLLLLGWTLLTMPAARVLFEAPDLLFLRELPVPRWWLLGSTALAIFALHLPWALLWWRGGNLGSALTSAFAAATLSCWWFRFALDRRLIFAMLVLVLWTTLGASFWSLPLTLFAFIASGRSAWLLAVEPRGTGRHTICTRNRWLALVTAFQVCLARGRASVLERAALIAASVTALLMLGLLNNQVIDPALVIRWTLITWGPASLLGAIGVAGSVLGIEADARWILDVCGVPRLLRAAAAASIPSSIGATLGAGVGVCTGAALGLLPWTVVSLASWATAEGAAYGWLAMTIVRATTWRTRGRDSARLLAAGLGACASGALFVIVPPGAVIVGVLALAAVLSLWSQQAETRRRRLQQVSC